MLAAKVRYPIFLLFGDEAVTFGGYIKAIALVDLAKFRHFQPQ